MENQDLDLLGQTVGNMFYKIGIVDKDGKVTNQFVANASTNRVDIPESVLGTAQSTVPQIPSTTNLFSGSAYGDILLSGPSANYDNIQDGLLLTLANTASQAEDIKNGYVHMDLPDGLKTIKIPKEKLVVNSSFDISDQLSQYIGQRAFGQSFNTEDDTWHNFPGVYNIVDFDGTKINVLPNTTLNMNLSVTIRQAPSYGTQAYDSIKISVIQVNDYKN